MGRVVLEAYAQLADEAARAVSAIGITWYPEDVYPTRLVNVRFDRSALGGGAISHLCGDVPIDTRRGAGNEIPGWLNSRHIPKQFQQLGCGGEPARRDGAGVAREPRVAGICPMVQQEVHCLLIVDRQSAFASMHRILPTC